MRKKKKIQYLNRMQLNVCGRKCGLKAEAVAAEKTGDWNLSSTLFQLG